jgi:hypothetical protein
MIAPGKTRCPTCTGAGYVHPPPPPHAWLRCPACDGIGSVWKPDGPRFGAPMCLAERTPGEIVELATGDRARILWHMPRKARRVRPAVTFVALIDDFDDHESDTPTAYHSEIGVVSVAAKQGLQLAGAAADDDHAGEKDADLVDPFAKRQRDAEAMF